MESLGSADMETRAALRLDSECAPCSPVLASVSPSVLSRVVPTGFLERQMERVLESRAHVSMEDQKVQASGELPVVDGKRAGHENRLDSHAKGEPLGRKRTWERNAACPLSRKYLEASSSRPLGHDCCLVGCFCFGG